MYPGPQKRIRSFPEVLELLDLDGSHAAQVSEPIGSMLAPDESTPVYEYDMRVSAKNQPPDRETGWFMTPGSTWFLGLPQHCLGSLAPTELLVQPSWRHKSTGDLKAPDEDPSTSMVQEESWTYHSTTLTAIGQRIFRLSPFG